MINPLDNNTSENPVLVPSVSAESMRVDIDKLNKIINLSGELLISKIRLKELVGVLNIKLEPQKDSSGSLGALMRDLNNISANIDSLTKDMQEEVVNARMVPIGHLFNIFPRAMRELAFSKGKDIDFQIKGEDTHLDKAIIDQMKDPIMHLLRNALDHGIESLQERKQKGKPSKGKVILSAYREGTQVVIEVSDDGAGINISEVKKKALKKGLVSKERLDDMAPEQAYQLLFSPGFSTKDEVSETSGRGVGLDVVRENIAKLKGVVNLKSTQGIGTSFYMKVPLTLAVSESLLVEVGIDTFAIPIESVVETIRIKPTDNNSIETKEAIDLRGHILPLVRLGDIVNLSRKGIFEKRFFSVVVVQSVEKRIGILVHELKGRMQILSKPIGDPLKNVKNILGATILGNGQVILILDIPSIIDSAEGVVIKRPAPKPEAQTAKIKKKKTILLAEDVLTTAMLEKNILESVGYSVVIARDGQEAFERALQESFDLIITDVLMPGMDGFQLVEKLRKDKLYKEVPIIIVTTRESDADKHRGLQAGADAYILKSEFTSEGLLGVLERLLG